MKSEMTFLYWTDPETDEGRKLAFEAIQKLTDSELKLAANRAFSAPRRRIPIKESPSEVVNRLSDFGFSIISESDSQTKPVSKIHSGAAEKNPQVSLQTPKTEGDSQPDPSSKANSNGSGEEPSAQTKKSNTRMIVWTLVVLLAVWEYNWINSDDDQNASNNGSSVNTEAPQRFDAIVMCKQFVENRLVSPSSADFPWADYLTFEWSVPYGHGWIVKGYVDAQNRFGAVIRINWHCKVSTVDNGQTWQLHDLEMLER